MTFKLDLERGASQGPRGLVVISSVISAEFHKNLIEYDRYDLCSTEEMEEIFLCDIFRRVELIY